MDETFDHRQPSRGCRVEGCRPWTRTHHPEVLRDAFLLSFGVILVAELGDKCQLMALATLTATSTVRAR
jgi:putative Ca2+/H+ antiporter (TMEM165/GDT1 family)